MGQTALKFCPNCKKPAAEKYWPFCSARCAQIDLGRWLGEKYAVPTNEIPAETGRESDEEGS
ncbi:MAG: DNA gyrase inhibitor YacG [Alphaproteobacteria bacterium]|nr:DNA gyrase inhibitor YacG [Alphaproteobacteria bacterium]